MILRFMQSCISTIALSAGIEKKQIFVCCLGVITLIIPKEWAISKGLVRTRGWIMGPLLSSVHLTMKFTAWHVRRAEKWWFISTGERILHTFLFSSHILKFYFKKSIFSYRVLINGCGTCLNDLNMITKLRNFLKLKKTVQIH